MKSPLTLELVASAKQLREKIRTCGKRKAVIALPPTTPATFPSELTITSATMVENIRASGRKDAGYSPRVKGSVFTVPVDWWAVEYQCGPFWDASALGYVAGILGINDVEYAPATILSQETVDQWDGLNFSVVQEHREEFETTVLEYMKTLMAVKCPDEYSLRMSYRHNPSAKLGVRAKYMCWLSVDLLKNDKPWKKVQVGVHLGDESIVDGFARWLDSVIVPMTKK